MYYFLYINDLTDFEILVESIIGENNLALNHHYESVAMIMVGKLSSNEIVLDRLISEALKLLH